MKKQIICLFLLISMLVCVLPVQAAEAEMEVLVRASESTVQVGDTVEFTVLATGSGVTAMQFQLLLPEGLQYVPNSGATPEKLAQKLGVPAADWTEQSKMFTFYNDIGITFVKGTEILRFSCVAQKAGNWEVSLYELLPFDPNFEEFPAKLQVQSVKVVGEEADTPVSGEVVQTVPDETLPSVPEDTEASVTVETTGQSDETPLPVLTEPTDDEATSIPEQEAVQESLTPEQEGPTAAPSVLSGILAIFGSFGALVGLAAAGIAIAVAVVVIIVIIKKKRS